MYEEHVYRSEGKINKDKEKPINFPHYSIDKNTVSESSWKQCSETAYPTHTLPIKSPILVTGGVVKDQ